MLASLFEPLYESLVDMLQNQVSILVLCILLAIITLLIGASFSNAWRMFLVRARFLEKDETPQSLLVWVLGVIFIVKLFQAFVLQPFIVDGASMIPTFHNKEFLLADKLSYHLHEPHRGDVVIFKFYEKKGSTYEGKYLIKRLLGLPGERIVVRRGTTTIYNKEHPTGVALAEPYVENTDLIKDIDITLTDSQYFVMGDNRAESYDSRSWGALDKQYLRGRVLARILPLRSVGLNPGYYSYSN